jgi:hypothetical protein
MESAKKPKIMYTMYGPIPYPEECPRCGSFSKRAYFNPLGCYDYDHHEWHDSPPKKKHSNTEEVCMELEIVNDDLDMLYGDMQVDKVDSMEVAENVVHRVLLKQELVNEVEERAKQAIARIKEWEKGAKDSIQKEIHLDMEALRPWANAQLSDRRVRFVDTIAGKISFRKVKGATKGQNLKDTIAWYKENWPEYLYEETVLKLNVEKAKELWREHGEKAPTIDFGEEGDRMYVEGTK